jgi:predicted permease
VLLAWLTFDFVVRAVPATLFLLGTPEIDLRVLAFAIGCGVSTVALFGALPAVQLARTPLVTTLAAGSRTAAHGRGAAGGLLVALESGLAMVLLAGGGLMANSFLRVHLQETGFSDPGGVLTMEATFGTPERLPNTREAEAFASMLLERVRGLPGVTGAALTNNLLTRTYFGSPFRLPSGARRGAYLLIVSPDYFRVMGIPLKAGRTFDPATDEPGRVVVVNENVAEAFWPGTNPVGRVLESRTHSAQVIGVVANTRDVALDVEMPPNIYVQHGTWAGPTNTTLIVRTSASPASLSREIREAVRILDPDVALTAATTLDAGLSASAAMRRFSLLLFGVFAGAGLLLASAGVYALVAYAVARRTKEIGIRKALGAQWRHIRRTIAGGVLGWVGIGLAAGLGGALVLSRALRSLLYHVEPTDPLTFAVVVLLLLTAAAAAAIVPARRALRVDPVIALRAE